MNQRAEREQLERLANEVRVYKQENLMLKVIGDDIDDDNHGHEARIVMVMIEEVG